MPLPQKMSESLLESLTKSGLLDPVIAEEVIADLNASKAIRWSTLFEKQLKLETEGNEADN